MDTTTARKEILDYTKQQLTGAGLKLVLKDNKEILNNQKPLDRCFTGFLFPIIQSEKGLDIIEENNGNDNYAYPVDSVCSAG